MNAKTDDGRIGQIGNRTKTKHMLNKPIIIMKQFKNLILAGALVLGLAGFAVSCDKYGDDIDNLQTQIDNQNKSLSDKLAAVESSIASLQSAQSNLESAIAAARDAAEKAALEAQEQAIETAKAELNTVKAELQAAIQANTGEIADVKAAVASLEDEVGSLQAVQDSLKSEIAAARDAADKAVLEAKNEAIEAAKTELNTVKAALETAIQENKDAIAAVDAAVKALEKKVAEDIAKVAGRVEALEAFQTTTEATLDELAKADEALNGSITELETELKAELVALGTRLTAVEAQIVALQNYKADIDANKEGVAANKEAIDKLVTDLATLEAGELTDEMIQAIAIRVEDIVGGVRSQLEVISVALKKQVTHVSLYTKANEGVAGNDLILNLVSAEAVRTWTFGEGMDGAISFTKDNKETFEYSLFIRVSPTTATLDKYMIRLVNSQMKDLSDLVEVKSIEPYTDLLLTKTVSQNGLWKVIVKLKDNYDADAYHDATAVYEEDGKTEKAKILYAVMVSGEEHDGREVVSEYGLTLAQKNKDHEKSLSFKVDETDVKKIHNRWNGTGASNSEDGTDVSYDELAWDEHGPHPEPIIKNNDPGKKVNVRKDDNDDEKRQPLAAYSVKAGKPFTVNFDEETAKNIRGFYVTLDEDCAVESEPSEINAWRSYHVKGLNTVTSDSSLELTIPEDVNADGDYIGFRVYAVNYDGSLVDPDGKAFYVYVGETAQTEANLTLTMDAKIVVPCADTVSSKTDAFSTANWGRANGGEYELVIKDAEGNDVTSTFDYTKFIFKDKDGNVVNLLTDATHLINDAAKITSVTTVEMSRVTASDMKDDMIYTAIITAKNASSGIVAVSTIKFKKVLPGFPTEVYPYTNILVNGNLKVYPVNENSRAEYDLKNAWHGIAQDNSGTAGYTNLLFSEIHDPAKAAAINYIPASNTLHADMSLVNPEDKKFGTKYPMAINYNYGQISQIYDAQAATWKKQDWNPAWGTPFTVEFGNYVYDCTFDWNGAAPKVTYPGAVGKDVFINLTNLKITDWYKEALDLKKMTTTGTKENMYIQAVELHFLTGANFERVDEYYVQGSPVFVDANGNDASGDMTKATRIKLTSTSNAAQGADVPTKVQLVITDNFGYKVTKTIDVPFTMTFQQ